MIRQAHNVDDVTPNEELDGGFEEAEDEEVDDYYYPSMSYSALLSTRSPDRFSALLHSSDESATSSQSKRSNVAVERYEHEHHEKDDSYPITSWENKWFDHAALLGRCMAEDLVTQDKMGCTVDRISMLKCHHGSKETTSCVLCEPIDWTERPATNAPEVPEEKSILTEYSEALLECSMICDELMCYDTTSQSASVPSPSEPSCEASVTMQTLVLSNDEKIELGAPHTVSNSEVDVAAIQDAVPEASISPEPELLERVVDSAGKEKEQKKDLPTCAICQAQFSTPYSLWYHTKLEHSSERYQCGLCEKNFVKKQQLTTHIKAHMNIKAFTCSFKDCKKSFLTAQHLRNHSKIHTGEKPYLCVECNKSFREKSSLKKHCLTHTGVKRYECDLCGKAFAQSSSRSHHRKTQHKQSPKSQTEPHRLTMEIAQIVELE